MRAAAIVKVEVAADGCPRPSNALIVDRYNLTNEPISNLRTPLNFLYSPDCFLSTPDHSRRYAASFAGSYDCYRHKGQ
jgi:hypothetical protein